MTEQHSGLQHGSLVWPCSVGETNPEVSNLTDTTPLVNTDFGTVYETTTTFNATAGVGSFNGSFVVPTLRLVNNSISYWTLATASTFLLNPQFSTRSAPILCSPNASFCESYLLPGGPQSLVPPPSSPNSDPVVVVHNSLSSQVEFNAGVKVAVKFDSSDCTAYGEERYVVGLIFCVTRGPTSNGSVIASKSIKNLLALNEVPISELRGGGQKFS